MPWNLYSQNSNDINSNPYMRGGNEKTKLKKLLFLAIGIIVAVGTIVLVANVSHPRSEQDKNTKEATAAARKVTPNAEVRKVKVADGFAIAIVSDPAADAQAYAGSSTIFKVEKDGSMTQIANGSYFSPIDLLELGIPLATQAKLDGRNLTQVQQDLAGLCGYSGGNVPGYFGFNASFNPDGWQVDATTLDGIEQALTAEISNKNAKVKNGDKVICVSATREKSNATTDKQTYISTFTLQLQLINDNGIATNRTFSFVIGPKNYRSYTLDGQKI